MAWFADLSAPVQFGIIAAFCFALLGVYALVFFAIKRGFRIKKADVEITVNEDEPEPAAAPAAQIKTIDTPK